MYIIKAKSYIIFIQKNEGKMKLKWLDIYFRKKYCYQSKVKKQSNKNQKLTNYPSQTK